MGLTVECLEFVGKLVTVTPQYGYGYGWAFGPESPFQKYEEIAALGRFRIRIRELFQNEGNISGGLGKIEQPGCAINGSLVAFSPRHIGDWNFVSRVGSYNVDIGVQLEHGPNGAIATSGFPSLQGFASIEHAD